jgi:uncharacterized protein (TIGR02246 family)
MRSTTIVGVFLLAMSAVIVVRAQQAPPKTPATRPAAQPSAGDRAADEKAIRQIADNFAKAYNTHDAKSLAALFTADGEIVNEEGEVTQGRAAIEEEFAGIFEGMPQSKISVSIKSIRFLAPNLAAEDGSASVTPAPGELGGLTRYTVIHVKQDGKWQVASTRDYPDEEIADHELKQLEWLIGEWVDESPDSVVISNYRWTENKRYILSDFTVQMGGRGVMTGSQRIGWDPLAKVVRSWVFDSEGGFVEGSYAHDGDRWIVKLSGVTREGKVASATNTLTRIGKDRMTWESRDRIVDGETTPDIPPVTVVRKPPKPQSQLSAAP